MLDISKPLTTGKVQSYYRSEYASASNSYFTEGGTLRGEWHGRLAPTLKLSGEVTAQAFDRLSEGQHPETGEQLIKHRDTIKTQAGEELGHRAGWDLTFNAPKTISLTALVGEDERVRQAHRNAVRVALDATENYVQARLGGNNPAETTGKWIAATFDHDTARPVDGYPAPHLHTHVVVFNMTEDRFGQARSLQPYELFKVQSMSTAVYQNQLEYELRQLGYQIQRGKNHAPEIKGYSPEYLQAESQRSAEIRRAMEEKGIGGREAAGYIAHQVREEKLKLTPDELRAVHQRNAAEFGHQPHQVVREAAGRHVRELSAEKTQEKSQAAINFARERLSERSAVFEHFETIRDALRHTHGRARLPDIVAELDRQKTAQRFLEVRHIRPSAPAARYTTPELIHTERETIERVRARGNTVAAVQGISYGTVLARYGNSLNDDQRRLVYEALTTSNQIAGIQGGAGTGKTTALAAVRELAEEHGYRAVGLGPTSRAAKELRNAGIDSETLQAYLTRGQTAPEDQRPKLFFVDESSLTSGKQMYQLLQTVQPQDRVLLIGDTRQHQSIEAGRIFAELQDAGIQTIRLEKIVRQKEEGLRQAVEAMAAGRIGEGVELLASQHRIHSVEHRDERLAAIARAYAASPEGTLVISPDNRSRKELNAAIRTELRDANQLGPDVYRLPVLVSRQELTSEDRGIASSYHVGDSVRYLRGSEILGIEPKSYATVIDIDSEHNQITVKKPDGQVVTYDPGRLRGVALYEPEIRSFAEGDRVQFTSPWKDKGISNRDIGTVTHLDANGNIRVQLDHSERVVGWNLRENQHLDYAYAMTSHSSQGATVDQVFIHVDTSDSKSRALIDETLAYVATSRPRCDAQIFTDNEDQLAGALSRRHENATALAPEEIDSYAMAV
ncbi:MAG: relaxase domain-containing protein [Acidobacteriaceae bacterium]|nr:relaxase domain-containing protein [Acidobacteriaceae bacterium]